MPDSPNRSTRRAAAKTAEKKAPPTKKAPTRPAPKPATSLAARVQQLETELAETRWCLAEVLWKAKVAAAKQMLNHPAVQEALAAKMIAQQDRLG